MYPPHPRTSVPGPLLGHLCQDLGVLRRPREAGAAELGGSVPFCLHIGLRLKTKLSDFRTFHSSKNNCTWGKNTCRHFSKSSSRFHHVPKASGIDRFGLPRTKCAYPCQPHLPRLPKFFCAKAVVQKRRHTGRHRAALARPYYVTGSKTLPRTHRSHMPGPR